MDDWIKRADASGIVMLKKFAKTLASHRSAILAYYDKTLNRQAYGCQDIEFFKLRILAFNRMNYRLIG